MGCLNRFKISHSFIHLCTRYSSGQDRGVASLGGLEIVHDFQQHQIDLLKVGHLNLGALGKRQKHRHCER